MLPIAQFLTYPHICAQGKTDSRLPLATGPKDAPSLGTAGACGQQSNVECSFARIDPKPAPVDRNLSAKMAWRHQRELPAPTTPLPMAGTLPGPASYDARALSWHPAQI
ncbi:MAG: hypothetical protein FWD12_12690, partial [Alphaproteobacteria bacterium]|nr:hypothetical protein [Alphaproteobacteria bacterium]